MKWRSIVAAACVCLVGRAAADVINGSQGLPHTRAAWVAAGRLTLLSNTRFWGKSHQTVSGDAGVPTAEAVWDLQNLLSIDYGLGSHFLINVTPVLYQDDQRKTGQFPHDLYVGMKIASFGSPEGPFKYGAHLQARFPTGRQHNLRYENYTTGKADWEVTGLMSYAFDPFYPEDAFNLHLNLGYLNHNDVGQVLTNSSDADGRVLRQSQQAEYAIGFNLPATRFTYGLEWYGNRWLQKPPRRAESRENFSYVNAAVTYRPYRWLQVFVSGEVRVSPDRQETRFSETERSAVRDLPDYPSWRINWGLQFTLLPLSVFRSSEREKLIEKADDRRELFEQIIRERRDTETAEEELERIREERRKAEKELERLRKILESPSDRKPDDVDEMRKELEPKP